MISHLYPCSSFGLMNLKLIKDLKSVITKPLICFDKSIWWIKIHNVTSYVFVVNFKCISMWSHFNHFFKYFSIINHWIQNKLKICSLCSSNKHLRKWNPTIKILNYGFQERTLFFLFCSIRSPTSLIKFLL